MESINRALTSVVTILLVGLILSLVVSIQQKTEKDAIKDKSICYTHSGEIFMWIMSGVAILLTLAAVICTILSIVNPEMMGTSTDDIWGITLTLVLSIAVDVLTIVGAIISTRKITYNDNSFTDNRVDRKKRQYFYKDITKIESTVKITYDGRKGKLKIYFGEKCVKIPATMFGVKEFMTVLHTKCPELRF